MEPKPNVDNVNDLAYDPNYYLQIKYGDVYAFSGTAPDTDVANGYYGIIDEDGNTVVIKAKGNESLKFTSGFYRDLDGFLLILQNSKHTELRFD